MLVYSLLFLRQSMLPDNFNPEQLGEDEEYIRTRKKRRGTVSNIWELQAVLNEEVNDDIDFIASATGGTFLEEGEEEEISEEAQPGAFELHEKDIYAVEGLYTTHL